MAISEAARHEIAELLVVMYNAAPGLTYLSQIVQAYQALGSNLQSLAEVLGDHPSYTSTHPAAWSEVDFATSLLTPFGLQDDVVARTAVEQAVLDGVSFADISYQGYLFLNQVYAAGPDSEYGQQYKDAANMLQNKADVSIYYSVTKGLSATDLETLQHVLDGVTADPNSVQAAKDNIDHLNDPQTFSVTVDEGATVTEGDAGTKSLTFVLHLQDQNGGSPVHETTLNWSTGTGTAAANDDYQVAAGQVTFAPGQTTATISVQIVGDTVYEGDHDPETVVLNISGETLGLPVIAVGTIVDNDPAPVIYTLGIVSAGVVEGDSGTQLMSFQITLSQPATAPVSFSWTTNGNGDATAGSDYTAASGTVSFVTGQTTATVSVSVNGDTTPEANETIGITVSGAQVTGGATGTLGTIFNDDTTFTLTIHQDNVNGSDFEDTIIGTELTFTLNDNIDGGASHDVMELTFDGNPLDPEVIVAPFVDVANVEEIIIFSDLTVGSDDDTFDMSTWTGVETIEIHTAGIADVNIESNASDLVWVDSGDNASIVDNTVDAILVDADGDASVKAEGASSVDVGAGGNVDVDVDDATVIIDAGGDTTLVGGNIDATVDAGGSITVTPDAGSTGTLDLTAGGTITVNSGSSDMVVTADAVGSVTIYNSDGDITADSGEDITIDAGNSANIDADAGNQSNDTVWIDAMAAGNILATAGGDAHVQVDSADRVEAHGNMGWDISGSDVDVVATDLVEWTFNSYPFFSDAFVDIGGIGEDGDVRVDAMSAGSVSVNGAEDVTIWTDNLDSVTLTNMFDRSNDHDVLIRTAGASDNASLDLTMSDAYVDSLVITGPTNLNLSVLSDSYASLDSPSTIETITLTGAGDLELWTTDVDPTLTTISGGDFTGDLTLYADGPIDVTSGIGDDYVTVWGTDSEDINVNAGEGNNYVDVNGGNVVTITTGDGSDDVELDWEAFNHEGSFVHLGGGNNSLTLVSDSPSLTGDDLTGFDIDALVADGKLAGSLRELNFDADFTLASDSTTTLDLSGMGGQVDYVSFGALDVTGSYSDVTDFTITGSSDSLEVYANNFGGDDGGRISLTAEGVTDLSLTSYSDMDVNVMGQDLVNFSAYVIDSDADITIDGDSSDVLPRDTYSDGVQDQLMDLQTVEVYAYEDATVRVAHLGMATDSAVTDITVESGSSDATLDINQSNIGNVVVQSHSWSGYDSAELNVNGTSDSVVSIDTIRVVALADNFLVTNSDGSFALDSDGEYQIVPLTSGPGDGYANVNIDYNSDSDLDIGPVEIVGGYSADMSVNSNDHAVMDIEDIRMTSWGWASLEVNHNNDLAIGRQPEITLHDISIDAAYSAGVQLNDNNDASIETGDITINANGYDFFGEDASYVEIMSDDDSTVTVGNIDIFSGSNMGVVTVGEHDRAAIEGLNVSVESSDSDAAFGIGFDLVGIGEDAYNTDTEVVFQDVTLTSWYDDTYLVVVNNVAVDQFSAVQLGDVTMSAGEDAYLAIQANSDSTVIVQNVGMFVESGTAYVDIGNGWQNANWDSTVEIGNISITGSDGASADVNASGSNSDWTEIGNLSILGGNVGFSESAHVAVLSDADVWLDELDDAGTVTVNVGGNADVWMEDVLLAGAVSIDAGDDAELDVLSVTGTASITVHGSTDTVEGSDNTDVYVSDAADLLTLTVIGGVHVSDSTEVYATDVAKMTTLTAGGIDVTVTLVNLDGDDSLNGTDGSAFTTLDLLGAIGDGGSDGDGTVVDASAADFKAGATGTMIKIGEGDLWYEADAVNDTLAGSNLGSREIFRFMGDEIGDVEITGFYAGQGFAYSPDSPTIPAQWTDRLDFSQTDLVDSFDDMSFVAVGNDVIITFANTAGSITLIGVAADPNWTDTVHDSIIL